MGRKQSCKNSFLVSSFGNGISATDVAVGDMVVQR